MITYPLNLPTKPAPAAIRISHKSLNALVSSPFTGSHQVLEYDGRWFEIDITLPNMTLAEAIVWRTFLLKLNGIIGTFLAGDPTYVKQGDLSAATLDGAHAARVKELNLDGMTVGQELKAGDYFQLGSGAASRLHINLNDMVADGSGQGVIDIWPPTRTAYNDAEVLELANPKGLFRLAQNDTSHEVGQGNIYSDMILVGQEAI